MRQSILTFFLFVASLGRCDSALNNKAAIDAKTETNFIFFGDWGTGAKDQKDVAAGMKKFCQATPCEFAAILGDNFYPSGVKSVDDPQWKTKFLNVYESLGLVFHVSLGNHDYGLNPDAQIDFTAKSKLWKMDSRYFTFTKGIAEFFVIDTNQFNLTQQNWLKEKLAASTASWKIVYGHHPIYSYGMHGNSGELIRDLLPLIKDKADFYLAGHDHDMQVLTGVEKLNLVVAGAASMVRPVKKGDRTLFSAEKLGFSHLQLKSNGAVLKMLDKEGKVLFTKEYAHPGL